MKLHALLRYHDTIAVAPLGASAPPPPGARPHPLVATRTPEPKDLHMDCIPFLGMFEAATFVEPRLLALPQPRATPAPRAPLWKAPDTLQYARSLGKVNKLFLAPVAEVPEPFPLLGTIKDADRDRS